MKGQHVKVARGLDLPIEGAPDLRACDVVSVRTVAVLGSDYNGLKPTMLVQVGDHVKQGQALFEDKKNPGVRITAPGGGTITEINRGARRALQSVVIELDENESCETFASYSASDAQQLPREAVVKNLLDSGLWTSLRTRPYSKIPAVDAVPEAIFVTAMDTRPLAADPAPLINADAEAFTLGLQLLATLTEGYVHVASAPGATLPSVEHDRVCMHQFDGPHPAGLAGTHIHFLHPVSAERTVWTANYADVIAIGQLFTTGTLPVTRTIALGGPRVQHPQLITTRLGASVAQLTEGRLADSAHDAPARTVSGSVLDGNHAEGRLGYLGRYHLQVSVLDEGQPRQFLHWVNPLLDWFSVLRVFTNNADKSRKFAFSTSRNGSTRAMVPIGNYEAVMPQDMLPTTLLRSLLVRDTDSAQQQGCMELDEEDLALCTFVCHSKYEYGSALRESLEIIEREG